MKKLILTLGAAAIFGFGVAALDADDAAPQPKAQVAPDQNGAVGPTATPDQTQSAEQNPLAPDFTLTDIKTGKPLNLHSLRGKVVLVDFWATWCGPCRMAIPHLIELQQEYRAKGLRVVGISLDQQGPAVVKPFYKEWKMNYSVVVDDTGTVARDYGGIRSIPTALLIDKTGHITAGFIGYRPKEEYESYIKAALAKKG
jgi:cytochrome c biogenesis protein CcmG/thiol:disulfide interchange protein DsbE